MPFDPSEIPGAIRSVSDLVNGILSRGDRDEPDRLKLSRVAAWMGAVEKWPDDGGDAAAAFIVRLLAATGYPPAPERDPERARKALIHSCGLALIDALHERELVVRAFAKLTHG